MKKTFLITLLTLTVYGHAREKPNIVLFLVDDMGWMDSSVPFGGEGLPRNKLFHTPNMERLAREGMIFTNAYAAPVCTPSRVSLMTGMNAAHHNVTNWTSPEKDVPSDGVSSTTALLPPDWNYNGFSPEKGISHTIYGTPLPRLLQDAGYFTIHIGKAHFAASGTPAASPYNMGFVVNVAGTMVGMPQSYYGKKNFGNIADETTFQAVQNMSEYYGKDVYLTEALTSEALKMLDYPLKKHEPFFLYFAHYAVHAPVQKDPKYYDRYIAEGADKGEAAYSSQIEGMDKSLGDVMAYLKQHDAEKNTLILFMSDNGGNSITPQKGGVQHTQNQPLREGKGSVYEGGIREPMIVKWPGVVQPGSKTDRPVIIEDYFPTLLEIAGATSAPIEQKVDGQSFVPILKNPNAGDADRVLTWHFPNKWKDDELPDIDFLSALRKGDWKLIYNMPKAKLELYNLKLDIEERQDVAAQNPAIVAELSKLMGDQYRNWGTMMPIVRATGKAVSWPDELSADH